MIIDNVFHRKSQSIFLLSATLTLMFQLSGCVVTSNFYSGRVVEEGKFAVTTGVDNIFIKSNTGSIEVTDKSPYAPSMALAYGFPLRIEGNLRFMPPRFIELTLRHQVNPPSFDFVDGSINVHYGHFFGGYSYVKYGATLK